MFPILYDNIERNINAQQAPKLIVPQHYGLGVLSDCISCEVEQENNGIFECVFEYPMSGIHASEIASERIVKAKPNFADQPQLFYIDRIGKTMSNGHFMVYCKHISYKISGYIIARGSANNIESACALLETATNKDFKIFTPRQTVANFSIGEPASVKSFFVGKKGSILDVYGHSDIKYDNFEVDFLSDAGTNRGVTIRYGKNLLELSQEINSANLYTHVVCYYKEGEDEAIMGEPAPTGLSLSIPKTLAVDCTSDYEQVPDEEELILELSQKAEDYVDTHNLTVPTNNIKLDYVQSGELTERVDLCDTVTIYYEALGISRTNVKCIRTKYDCLREKYIEIEFGDIKQDLSDTITGTNSALNEAVSLADNKRRVFMNQPVPPYDIGDLWVNNGAIYGCVTSRLKTITDSAEGAVASFDALIYADLVECVCQIEPDAEGFSSVIITVANGDLEVQKAYSIELGEVLTQGGELDVINGILKRTDESIKEFDTSKYEIPETIIGRNNISCNTGNIALKYHVVGFSQADWELATDYVNDDVLASAVNRSSQLITGGLGGNVVINRTSDGTPYEIIIFKTEHPEDEQILANAKYVWRWNSGGLGYSSDGYDSQNYELALNSNGEINADMITTGTLDAGAITVMNLTAAMFAGQEIDLGGVGNEAGVLKIYDKTGTKVLAKMDADGVECFGETVNGITPSVVFDKDGVTGYSNSDPEYKPTSKLFWTNKDSFGMKNAVIENQLNVGGMLKFVPITIRDSNDNITNQGIAIVPII